MFFLLYRYPDDDVFEDFPKIFDHFPKILENLSEGHTNVTDIFRKRPKISEDVRRFPKIAEGFRRDPKVFRSCTNELKNNLRDKLKSSEIIDILTSEDIENTPLESRM